MNIRSIMHTAPVIPVITLESLDDALPLAQALLDGGLSVLEITLRTAPALEAITLIRSRFPDAIVGAGTVLNPEAFQDAENSGAQFVVSPGFTQELLHAQKTIQVPLLPGVNTPSEIMTLLQHGINAMKFFPAEAAGGVAMLKSLAAPLPQALFCPTGGISLHNAPDYLALPNVACIGGSWMVGKDLMIAKDWARIRELAAQAAALSS